MSVLFFHLLVLGQVKKLDRRFIGFELSKEYAKQIQTRLASVKPGEALTGPENPVRSAPRTKAGRRLARRKSPGSNGDSKSAVAARELF